MDAALIDSAQHKLRLARYHGETLLAVLAQAPPDDLDNDLRVAMEAHLEGLAYQGTAAAEKTIRAVDAQNISEHSPIERMILAARQANLDRDLQDFVGRFEGWWVGRGQATRYAQTARDLRNDAAHAVYDKTPDGPRWQMRIRGGRPAINLETFADGYLAELTALAALVAEASARAGAPAQ